MEVALKRPLKPQWSMLHRELLEMVLGKLDLADHARFSSVCSWWRWVAMENPPTNKPLGLVRSGNPEGLLRRLLTSLRPLWAEARFLGCFEGWLVALINCRELFLFNVGSGEQIPLPPPPYPQHTLRAFGCKAVLSSPPMTSSSSASGGTNFCSSNCTIVLRDPYGRRMAFCRLGDAAFTMFYPPPQPLANGGVVMDVCFYKGRLYAALGDKSVLVFDGGLDSKPTELHIGPLPSGYTVIYLAVSGDDKLLAIGMRPKRRGLLYMVFELLDPISPHPRWARVESLGDNLLLDGLCPQSLSSKDHPEFRGNHIYWLKPPSLYAFSLEDRVMKSQLLGNTSLLLLTLFMPSGFTHAAQQIM